MKFRSLHKIASGISALMLTGLGYADITVSLDQDFKSVEVPTFGSTDVIFSGKCNVNVRFNGAWALPMYPYRYRTFAFADHLDAEIHPNFVSFLSDLGVHANGGVYHGALFKVTVNSTNKGGYYNHSGASATYPPVFYVHVDGPDGTFESNRVTFTLGLVGNEKQIDCQMLDAGYAGVWYSWPFDVQIYQGPNLVGTDTAIPDPDGTFHLDQNLPSGDLSLLIHGGHWLSKRKTVTVANGFSMGNTVAMLNGDIDKDNVITVFDYGVLSTYFDRSVDDGITPDYWTPGPDGFAPIDADLDEDGAVTVFDYGYINDNFDKAGDE